MKKGIKIFITIVLIISALVIAFLLYIYSPYFPWEKEKAAEVAEEYIFQTYGVELEAESVESNIVMLDGGGYNVFFTSKYGVPFEVHMPYEQKVDYCWSNYEKALFESQFKEQHEQNIKTLWDEEIRLSTTSSWMRDDELPVYNGFLNYERYEKDARYYITIEVADKVDRVKDAQKIYDTISYIRDKNLNAHTIIISYMNSEYGHAGDVWFELDQEEFETVNDVKDKLK